MVWYFHNYLCLLWFCRSYSKMAFQFFFFSYRIYIMWNDITVDIHCVGIFVPRIFLCFPRCFLLCTVHWLFYPFHLHVHHRPTLYFSCMFCSFPFVSAGLTDFFSIVVELALSRYSSFVPHGFRLFAYLSNHRSHHRFSLCCDDILLILSWCC